MKDMSMKYLGQLFLWSILLSSCGKVQQLDTSEIKDIMENSKIKKVSETDIAGALNVLGEEVYATYQIPDCQQAKMQRDSLTQAYKLNISNVKSDLAGLTEKEAATAEALLYSAAEGEEVGPTPQKLTDTTYAIYYTIKNGSCQSDSDSGQTQLWKVECSKESLIKAIR